MSVDHGDPEPFAAAPARLNTRLVRLLLVAGTITFVVLTVRTFRVPGVPSLSGMEEVTSAAPWLSEHCEITYGGGVAPATTCAWSLLLDDGTRLAWPGPGLRNSPAEKSVYLREHGPVTVHFWRGTVYQIELRGGQVYLDRADVVGWESFWQWIRVVVGVLVGVASLMRLSLMFRHLRDPVTDPSVACRACVLDVVCLVGALLLGIVRADLRWSGVVGLAMFALIAPMVGGALVRDRGGPHRS